jgi:hypothetical protein
VGILKRCNISRNLDIIRAIKNVILSQTGAVSSEIVTKFPKNVLSLHDVRGVWDTR